MSDSKRARLPRKAAVTVSYAEKADALTESDDDDDAAARLERERAAKRKKAGKGKQKEEQAPQPVKCAYSPSRGPTSGRDSDSASPF